MNGNWWYRNWWHCVGLPLDPDVEWAMRDVPVSRGPITKLHGEENPDIERATRNKHFPGSRTAKETRQHTYRVTRSFLKSLFEYAGVSKAVVEAFACDPGADVCVLDATRPGGSDRVRDRVREAADGLLVNADVLVLPSAEEWGQKERLAAPAEPDVLVTTAGDAAGLTDACDSTYELDAGASVGEWRSVIADVALVDPTETTAGRAGEWVLDPDHPLVEPDAVNDAAVVPDGGVGIKTARDDEQCTIDTWCD